MESKLVKAGRDLDCTACQAIIPKGSIYRHLKGRGGTIMRKHYPPCADTSPETVSCPWCHCPLDKVVKPQNCYCIHHRSSKALAASESKLPRETAVSSPQRPPRPHLARNGYYLDWEDHRTFTALSEPKE